MKMQMQPVQDDGVRVPNVPMDSLRDYIRVLCQMHIIQNIVEPGHPWFEHHMRKMTKVSTHLKDKCALTRADMWAVPKIAQIEAERVLLHYHADVKVYVSVLESLQHGLPQVDNDRPV